jgi:hypothetical protein
VGSIPDGGRSWQLSSSDRAGVALSWGYLLSWKVVYGMLGDLIRHPIPAFHRHQGRREKGD